jgi:hypothetical protein
MSSDRSIYDKGAYLVKTEQSSKPLEWVLDINANENCKVCGPKPNVTGHVDRVALESDLFGLDRKHSRDPKEKYQKNDKIADTLNYHPAWVCERNIKSNDFLVNNVNAPNAYMDELRSKKPSDIKSKFDNSKNMCKLTNFLNNNNIDTTNTV